VGTWAGGLGNVGTWAGLGSVGTWAAGLPCCCGGLLSVVGCGISVLFSLLSSVIVIGSTPLDFPLFCEEIVTVTVFFFAGSVALVEVSMEISLDVAVLVVNGFVVIDILVSGLSVD